MLDIATKLLIYYVIVGNFAHRNVAKRDDSETFASRIGKPNSSK